MDIPSNFAANFSQNPTLAVTALKSAEQSQANITQLVAGAAQSVQSGSGQTTSTPPAGSGRGTNYDSYA